MSKANEINCGVGFRKGQGEAADCTLRMDQTKRVIRETKQLDNSELTRDLIIERIASGAWDISRSVYTATPESEENQFETSTTGDESLTSLGKYKYFFEFQADVYYHNVLHSLNSNGTENVLFLDRDKTLFGTGEALNGFTTNHITAERINASDGSTSSKTGLRTQLSNPEEIDGELNWFQTGSIDGIDLLKVDGASTVRLDVLATPAPTTTTASIKIVADGDGTTPITGLDSVDNFKLTGSDGIVYPVSAVVEDGATQGLYALTFATVPTGVTTFQLFDTVNNYANVTIDNGGSDISFYNGSTSITI